MASNDPNGNRDNASRRVSRVDLDFEQALLAGGTVMLKEGPDISTLGVDAATPTSSPHSNYFMSPSSLPQPMRRAKDGQPSTPTVVPPTPSPSTSTATGPSLSRVLSPAPSSSSGHYFDAEDGDLQTKRRSMFRSPGSASASSPDLATLVRKTKEKSRTPQGQSRGKDSQEHPSAFRTDALSPGLLPQQGESSRTRQRSSTTVQSQEPPLSHSNMSHQNNKGRSSKSHRVLGRDQDDRPNSPVGSEWVMASPRSRSDANSSKVT